MALQFCQSNASSVFFSSKCGGKQLILTNSFVHRSDGKQVTIFFNKKDAFGILRAKSNSFSIKCAVAQKERYGYSTVQGPGRASYEDSFSVEVDAAGNQPSFFGVFDGHGGSEVAKYLAKALWPALKQKLATSNDISRATAIAFQEVDAETIAPPKGFFGMMREHGMGGSRCGSTAATVVLIPGEKWKILAANVGDSKIVLSRGGKAVQITEDHKPDVEAERKRIEAKNPTPKKPLVQNIDGTWRVGGLLALSRAFGDVYLKDTSDGKRDGARAGFGLTAEPSLFVEDLQDDDSLLILGTDGFWDFVTNQEAVDFCIENAEKPPQTVASDLVQKALQNGNTDDVTVVVVRLPLV